MNKEEILAELRKLVSHNEIETAFKFLDNSLNPQSILFDQLIIQQSKYSKYKKEARNQTISYENSEITFSRICNSLLELAKGIKDTDLTVERKIISNHKINPEILDEYDNVINTYVRENKKLQFEVERLTEEVASLKANDSRLRLKNTIKLFGAVFSPFNAIVKSLNQIGSDIKLDIHNVDPKFAANLADEIDAHISDLSSIARDLSILEKKISILEKEKFASRKGFYFLGFKRMLPKNVKSLERARIAAKFGGLLNFCKNELVLNKAIIKQVKEELNQIMMHCAQLEGMENEKMMKVNKDEEWDKHFRY